MRVALLTLLALAAGAALHAQSTPAGKSTPVTKSAAKPDPKLDGYLNNWEKQMKKITTLQATLNRIDHDKAFDTKTRSTGYAQYMKAGTGNSVLNLALLEMKPDGKKEVTEKFISTGSYLYVFAPAQKEIRAYEIPRPKPGQVTDDNFMSFLFGMKAADAKKRYDLKLDREDKWYIYISVIPKSPADKADFTKARIVLNKDTYLPRQLWFVQPGKNEVTWDIPKIQTGVSLDRRVFDAPKPPPGWKLVPVSTGKTPPRVVRPNNR